MERPGTGEERGRGADARAISGAITGVILGYVHLLQGDEGVARLLRLAGESRPTDVLRDESQWFDYASACRLFEAADEVTGDPGSARRIGTHVLDQHAGTEVAAILRSFGSTEELLKNVATTAAKYSAVTSMEVLEVAADSARVAAVTRTGVVRDRHFCDYTAGVLSQSSVLFGHGPAEVHETECQTQGDARCLYEVSWRTDDGDAEADRRRIRQLEGELDGLTSRLEALQATATAFITARNADEVLSVITRRAGLAVRAPRFLLAVQLPSERRLRVHHEGFASDAEARQVARDILSGMTTGRTTHLVVEVVSAHSRFGILAAIHPDGTAFFPQERHLLEAYAAHAAAALEVTASLDEARRQNGTARALLEFGRSLSRIATVDEIVLRLTEAMPAVVDSDSGAVMLWDSAREVMTLHSTFGLPRDVAAPFEGFEVRPQDTPAIADLVRDRRTVFIDASTDDPFLAGLVAMAEMQSAAVVPIVVHDDIVGVLAIGRRDGEIRSHPDVLERLAGMADMAATAFRNARYLETVQTEALQDPLTGLANARLLARAADRALATPSSTSDDSVALLFVDLDGFKPVNDRFGHDAGDDVLRTCGRRLKSAVRESDTVARIGGDEFVVLMPQAGRAAAEATAARLRELLLEPIPIAGTEVRLSGSVGIAMASSDEDFRSLLKRADDAMYVAKGRRRPAPTPDPASA